MSDFKATCCKNGDGTITVSATDIDGTVNGDPVARLYQLASDVPYHTGPLQPDGCGYSETFTDKGAFSVEVDIQFDNKVTKKPKCSCG